MDGLTDGETDEDALGDLDGDSDLEADGDLEPVCIPTSCQTPGVPDVMQIINFPPTTHTSPTSAAPVGVALRL